MDKPSLKSKDSKIRIIIVDDSKIIRETLKKELSKEPGIEVIAVAEDAYIARDLIVKLRPDAITLDLQMPKMGGLEFIGILMKHWPLPIVVFSSIADNRDVCLEALKLGAVDIVLKPSASKLGEFSRAMERLKYILLNTREVKLNAGVIKGDSIKVTTSRLFAKEKVIAIGASTGGTEAVRNVLMSFPESSPGVLVTQHMPKEFTKSFASRLDQLCPNLQIREATHGEELLAGNVLIAPGDHHMLLRKVEKRYFVDIRRGPLVNRHRPAVDVTFFSVAECAGRNAIGALLTGMGADGAKGLLEMKNAGSMTIVQDEATSVVYGMPRAAVKLGAACHEVPLEKVASTIFKYV